MTDTSREHIERMIACAPFADQTAGVPEMAAALGALLNERDALRRLTQPEWFYPADGYDGENCYFGVHEVLDEHYFWDRCKTGEHVVEINVATSLPSIWAAVRFQCDCEDRDDCQCDNEMIVTEHSSEAEARAALTPASVMDAVKQGDTQ